MGVVLLFELVQVIQFGFVQALERGALVGGLGAVAGEFVEVERVQLELDGVADGLEAHGIAQVAIGDDFEVAAAHEAFAVGNGEPAGQFEAALAAPGVAHLRATDLIVLDDASALRTRRWHTYTSAAPTNSLVPTPMYSSMPRAARLPAPMARITVAAPVTISPPANSPGIDVMFVRSSTSM